LKDFEIADNREAYPQDLPAIPGDFPAGSFFNPLKLKQLQSRS
jgi:hypothetical protein